MIVAGHELHLFTESPAWLAALMADIRAAQRRVWLEFYIVADDAVGRTVVAALTERAAAGVEVRLLYDAVGSFSTTSGLFAPLVDAGGEVVAYHSVWDVLARRTLWQVLNRRNHRKLVVIDERVTHFGGMNLVDDAATAPAAPDGTPRHWRDLQLRLVGPQQAELVESFERSWRRARHEPVPRRTRAYRRGRLPRRGESIRFFDSGPGLGYTRAARVFTRLIRGARRSAVFSMAYFLPTGGVLRALLRARRRGVDVSIVVPEQSDVKLVEWATQFLLPRLLRRGFHLFERRDRMLHAKVLVVDGRWTVVGSCNLDARSLSYNLEFLAVIRSRKFAAVVAEICAHEISASRALSPADVAAQGWWQRWRAWAAYLLRYWL